MVPKTILITAGPTYEAIDPVRFIGNRSSGKMGYALAHQAIQMGHKVILISGPTKLAVPEKVNFISIINAQQMYDEVIKNYQQADIIIKVAAVSDYRPLNPSLTKIKKNQDTIELTLVKNPDILFELGKIKKPHQCLVGFAAETNNVFEYAKEKLIKKNCDWIVANDVSAQQTGFESDENEVYLISKDKDPIHLPKNSKLNLAAKILSIII